MTASATPQPEAEIEAAPPGSRPMLPAAVREGMRDSRRHPKPTQFDYLHLRRLLSDLQKAFDAIPGPVGDAVDIFCGTRPYDDLYPAGSRVVGYDIDEHYGPADVTGTDFLPFEDESFDLLTCIEGFHFVPNPEQGVAEFERVLRPGGTALLSVPLVWEYNREILEHRYTGPELENLFKDWESVEVVENGGRAVSWATLTGHLVSIAGNALPRGPRRLAAPLFGALYALINLVASGVDRLESRLATSPQTLPMNLLVTARKKGTADS